MAVGTKLGDIRLFNASNLRVSFFFFESRDAAGQAHDAGLGGAVVAGPLARHRGGAGDVDDRAPVNLGSSQSFCFRVFFS